MSRRPDREHAIFNVLRYYEARTAIVFCKTRVNVNICLPGWATGVPGGPCRANSASRSGRMRCKACATGARICIATDVAARASTCRAGSGDPRRSARQLRDAAAPLGPDGARGAEGRLGADRDARRVPEGAAPAAGAKWSRNGPRRPRPTRCARATRCGCWSIPRWCSRGRDERAMAEAILAARSGRNSGSGLCAALARGRSARKS